jgi:hypothetical protein
MTAIVWAGAAIAGVAAFLTALNIPFWPRGAARADAGGRRVSVLIPARNEEANIEDCVRSIAASQVDAAEIVVYNDGSTDATGTILERLRGEIGNLRVVQGVELPAGWIGKVHANYQLARAATGDLLVFVDADVRLLPTGLGRIVDVIDRYRCDILTANPRQISGTWLERLIMPMMYVTYLSWLFIPLMWHTRDPRVSAGNGQVFAFRREAYDRFGGLEAIKSELVDDMAIARRAKSLGMRIVLMDGHHTATCRMYRDSPSLWRGFSKNIYEGLSGGPVVLLVVATLHVLAWVIPPVALLAGALGAPGVVLPGAIGVGAALAQRVMISLRFDQRLLDGLAYPAGVLALVAIALNSWRCSASGRLEWAGRVYAARADRTK